MVRSVQLIGKPAKLCTGTALQVSTDMSRRQSARVCMHRVTTSFTSALLLSWCSAFLQIAASGERFLFVIIDARVE